MEENSFKIGDSVEAEVTKIHAFGAVVKLPNNKRGLIHISQISDDYVKNINEYLKIGDKVTAKIKKITSDGKIDLTLKKKKKVDIPVSREKEFKTCAFEEKLDAFLKKTKE
ncbi:MAG: S1 RNA-binding domain-containing protein [PVC group bacterium]|nr:S1 RNA-binding domain-containing protein [PVC group bacterium]